MYGRVNKKITKIQHYLPAFSQSKQFFDEIEDLMKTQNGLVLDHQCNCHICKHKVIKTMNQAPDLFVKQKGSDRNLLAVVSALSHPNILYLKIQIKIPVLCFYQHGVFVVYCNQTSDGTLATPFEISDQAQLIGFMKKHEEQLRKDRMIRRRKISTQQFDENFIYEKKFEKLFPSFFLQSTQNQLLRRNRCNFKNYIVHNDESYADEQVEEYKLKPHDPLCIFNYTDENYEIFTLENTELYTLEQLKKQKNIFYVESFTRVKKDVNAIYYSDYVYGGELKTRLFQKAKTQILILRGKINKLDPRYLDKVDLEENYLQISENIENLTYYNIYRIVVILEEFYDVFVKKMRIRWLLSENNEPILLQIVEYKYDNFLFKGQKHKTESKEFFSTIYSKVRYEQLEKRKKMKQHFLNERQQRYFSSDYRNKESSISNTPSVRQNRKKKVSLFPMARGKSEVVSTYGRQLPTRHKRLSMQGRIDKKKNNTFLLKPFKTEVSEEN